MNEQSVFIAAIQEPPEGRSAFLDRACAGDAELRGRVDRLIAAFDRAGTFLDGSAVEPGPRGDRLIGSLIGGKYRLVELLGEGGMGAVYRAEQSEPVRREVAVKLIRSNLTSKTALPRFEAERQALAMMQHPHIASIHDGGLTDDGDPYFVMELVRGTAITEYCDARRLPIRERLELFVAVCQAVQHAHQKGIIHRDLKPGNVLVAEVDGVATPKIIDFGVAKATEVRLTDKTIADFGAIVGTPTYMSPEQADPKSDDIDTRTDVYALGVILYELLVGAPPFDARQFAKSAMLEMLRMVIEDDPPRPSTKLSTADERSSIAANRAVEPGRLAESLRGELDWVVMKAIEKDRGRRYPTANGLGLDIQRFLDDEVVEARPPSAGYRLRKVLRRHRREAIAAGLVLLALVGGIVGTTLGLFEACRQTKTANVARALADTERSRAERELERSDWLLYASRLLLAESDFTTGRGGLALKYLERCDPSRRGWEHAYLTGRVDSAQKFRGHTGHVSCVAVSPDGKRIATASEDTTAIIWDAATARPLRTLRGHTCPLLGVAFSPDGRRLVTGGGRWGQQGRQLGEVKVWDVETGKVLHALNNHAGCVRSVEFSPDGTRLVTGCGDAYMPGEATVWDLANEKALHSLKSREVMSAKHSPDGTRIATACMDAIVRVWSAADGSLLRSLPGSPAGVFDIAWSPDGTWLAASCDDGRTRLWNTRDGSAGPTLRGHTHTVTGVGYRPDGQRIVTSSRDETARVWDAASGEELHVLKGQSGEVRKARFSPDGKSIFTCGNDRLARKWNAETGQRPAEVRGHTSTIMGIAIGPDDRRFATASLDGTVRTWNLATLAAERVMGGKGSPIHTLARHPDGRRVAVGSTDGIVRIWNIETGVLEKEWAAHPRRVLSVAYSADGRRLVSVTDMWGVNDPGEIKLWEPGRAEPIRTWRPPFAASKVAFHPDGGRIAVSLWNGEILVYEVESGTEVFRRTAHPGITHFVAYSVDGRQLLTGGGDFVARLWDARDGTPIMELTGHTGQVRTGAMMPDGSRIVTTSNDGTARIWHAATGIELLALREHAHEVWSLAISPDGRRLITGVTGANPTARVWTAETPSGPR